MATGIEVICDICTRRKGDGETWSVAVLPPAGGRRSISFAQSRDEYRVPGSGEVPPRMRFFDLCGEECQHKVLARWNAGEFPEPKETA